ncbi:MAG TPA: hypothetical protein G4N98_03375 [Thermoflexia bacterium]|nr:hypothetical protein [Thermoflexia bacterium]
MKLAHCLLLLMLSGLLLLTACEQKPLLAEVTFTPSTISPNADGRDDLTNISFRLNRNATVAIHFYAADGQQYTFRSPTPLSLNEEPYSVLFPGVVEGFTTEDEELPYQVLKRVLPDGPYQWEISAETTTGERVVVTGDLVVENADTELPGISGFSIYPQEFSPNQDGLDDRVRINAFLQKDVENLQLYMLDTAGIRHHIAEEEKNPTRLNQAGMHSFDYDGGIDAGGAPPPDGTYTIYAEARDRVGQRVLVTDELTLVNAGRPLAYILNAEVEWSTKSTLVLGDTLYFTLTVENDSHTLIRTSGPAAGTVYASDQNYATVGGTIESGVFRVGVHCENSMINYPWRWAIGNPETLIEDEAGHLYLPPAKRAIVTGGIRFVDVVEARNPQYCWAGLIHEDVEIAPVNNNVDPLFLKIISP